MAGGETDKSSVLFSLPINSTKAWLTTPIKAVRRQAADDFLAKGLFFDCVDEFFNDGQCNVGFQQGKMNLAQGFFNIVFGQR